MNECEEKVDTNDLFIVLFSFYSVIIFMIEWRPKNLDVFFDGFLWTNSVSNMLIRFMFTPFNIQHLTAVISFILVTEKPISLDKMYSNI